MTNRIADHESEWITLYWDCFTRRPAQIVMVEAGNLVAEWGWDEVKASMIYCGKNAIPWRGVMKFFEIKQKKRDELEKQAAACGQKPENGRAYENRNWENEQEVSPEAKALLERGKGEDEQD